MIPNMNMSDSMRYCLNWGINAADTLFIIVLISLMLCNVCYVIGYSIGAAEMSKTYKRVGDIREPKS